MTVREWFRLARGEMWRRDERERDLTDPWAASMVDKVAGFCTSPPPTASLVPCEFVWTYTGRAVELWIPRALAIEHQEQQARTALEELLRAAWPEADREKYDDTYAMLKRHRETGWYFRGLAD